MLSILINGALGKMGRTLAACAVEQGFGVSAGVDRYAAGAKCSFPLYERLCDCREQADVLVDFSRPDALEELLSYALERRLPLVLATTGYTAEQEALVQQAAKELAIFRTANMSLGVNVLLELARQAASELHGFDIEIVEKHHKTKADAPSGTALLLAEGLKQGLPEERQYVFGRQGLCPRQPQEIGIHAVRGGSVAGDHEILFLGEDETVTLSHSAASRRIFANGALKAAGYIVSQRPGLYNMRDLLLQNAGVTHLRAEQGQALVTLPDGGRGAAELFQGLASLDINVDMLAQSAREESFSFTLREEDLPRAKELLDGAKLVLGLVKLTVLGQGMEKQRGIAAGVLSQLAQVQAHPLLVTSSETQISLLLGEEEAQLAADALRRRYGLR